LDKQQKYAVLQLWGHDFIKFSSKSKTPGGKFAMKAWHLTSLMLKQKKKHHWPRYAFVETLG